MRLTDDQIKSLIIAVDMAIDQVRGDEQKELLDLRELLVLEVKDETH